MNFRPVIIAVLALFAIGCRGAATSAGFDAGAAVQAETPSAKASVARARDAGSATGTEAAPNLASYAETVQAARAVVRTAELSVRVDDVEKAESAAKAHLERLGGYIESASSSDLDTASPTLSMSARVPAPRFEQAIASFEQLGVRLTKRITSQDVTEQLVDMQARLKTMLAQEEAFRSMLRDARSLQTTIELQNQLMSLRGSIESIEAQRKSLAGNAALSTITLTLTQRSSVNSPPADPNWLSQGWGEASSSVGAALRTVAVIGLWLIAYAPFWIAMGATAWIVWKALRRKPFAAS